jgi:hypothetical protein
MIKKGSKWYIVSLLCAGVCYAWPTIYRISKYAAECRAVSKVSFVLHA